MAAATHDLARLLPGSWRGPLAGALDKPYARALAQFLAAEWAAHTVFPRREDIFRALELTPFEVVRVVILGQDPYHDVGQAHGLAFSVRQGVKPPPSLVNMFKELEADLGVPRPATGNLEPWARQGVLLLNTVLTVRAHQAASHQKKGWETFTDTVIQAIAARAAPAVFVLWGSHAQRKQALIEQVPRSPGEQHVVIASAHPSPLSAHRGFFSSRPFSRINAALATMGHAPIDWRL